MAAYATHQRGSSAPMFRLAAAPLDRSPARLVAEQSASRAGQFELAVIEQLLDRFAERVAVALADQMSAADERPDEWLDSRHAADYIGVHRDTVRKLAAERAIPPEQEGPGCKLYFRRSDLDAWRRSGGRPRHLMSSLDVAA